MFPFHNPILLGSIFATSLKENPMLFVETESITLNDFFGIITSNGLNFAIKWIFNKENNLFKKRGECTLMFDE